MTKGSDIKVDSSLAPTESINSYVKSYPSDQIADGVVELNLDHQAETKTESTGTFQLKQTDQHQSNTSQPDVPSANSGTLTSEAQKLDSQILPAEILFDPLRGKNYRYVHSQYSI